MLEKIKLKNWQCWKKLTVEFDRVTVLVGDNGAGKSSVLRALRWLALNEWEGKAGEYVSWGEGHCEVAAQFEGKYVRRVRRSSNHYVCAGRRLSLEGGTKVPARVQDVLRLGPDNFQRQHEPAFWMSLPPGQAAGALNELFNLEAIDTAMSNIKAELRTAKTRAAVSGERLKKFKATVAELEWTARADDMLKAVEDMAAQATALAIEEAELEAKKRRLETAVVAEKELEKLVELGSAAAQAGQKCLEADAELKGLEKLLDLEKEACRLERLLKAKQEELAKVMSLKCPLCGRR